MEAPYAIEPEYPVNEEMTPLRLEADLSATEDDSQDCENECASTTPLSDVCIDAADPDCKTDLSSTKQEAGKGSHNDSDGNGKVVNNKSGELLDDDNDDEDDDESESGAEESEEQLTPAARAASKRKKRLWTALRVGVVLAIILAVVLVLTLAPLKQVFMAISLWIEQQGPVGVVYCTLLFVFGVLSNLGGSVFGVITGFIYGFWTGLVVSYVGMNVGCVSCFLLGKLLSRRFSKTLLKRYKVLKTLGRVIDRSPTKMIFLLRLAHIPPPVQNYGLALFSVTPRMFALACLVCSIPECILLALFGSSAGDIVEVVNGTYSGSTLGVAAMGVGLAIMVVILVLIAYYTRIEWKKVSAEVDQARQAKKERRQLAKKLKQEQGEEETLQQQILLSQQQQQPSQIQPEQLSPLLLRGEDEDEDEEICGVAGDKIPLVALSPQRQ